MAEQSNGESSGSWWSSWIETAKLKSSEALEFMKRDLTELSQTVQQDTAAAVNTTAAILKDKLRVDNPDSVTNKARHGLTTIINTISDVFLPMREIENDEVFMIRNSQPVLLDRWETQLHAIRVDPNTYCHEPEGPPEVYEAWLESFDLDSYQQEISDIMVEYREVRALYAKLVPAAVSHVEFWQRYYYRVHLLKQTEAKRAELMKRAEIELPKEETIWDDDDEFSEIATSSSSMIHVNSEKFKHPNKGSAEDSDLDKDCDWEKDFDLDITDEDLKKLENNNKNTRPKEIEEDWENWE